MRNLKKAHLLSSKTKTFDMQSVSQCLLNHPIENKEKSVTDRNIVTLMAIMERNPKEKTIRKRILAEAEGPVVVGTIGASNESNDNVIYVKPDAIFGILLSLFIFFVTYVGVMCLFNTNTPKSFASKPFKFGREM